MKLRLLTDEELRALDVSELEARIGNLESGVQNALGELRRIRRRRSALIASAASKMARQMKLADQARQIYAAWGQLGSTRGAIPILVEQFNLPERTIHRRLKLAGRKRPEFDWWPTQRRDA